MSGYTCVSWSAWIAVFLLWACSIEHAQADANRTVCDPDLIVPSTDPKYARRPTINGTFHLRVEASFETSNTTVEFTEIYDQDQNKLALHSWTLGFHQDQIYDGNLNQLFTFSDQLKTDNCKVDTASNSSLSYLFGYQKENGAIKGHFFTALGALSYDKFNKDQYKGKATVRGIKCNVWSSCQYWQEIDSTMNILWYFSDPEKWDSPLGQVAVPVRAVVSGFTNGGKGGPHSFNHTYEFSDFQNTLSSHRVQRDFETPSGVFCPGRADSKPLPSPSTYFTFGSEEIDPDKKKLTTSQQWYDYDRNVFRYDYMADSTSQFGAGKISEVHDYLEGIRYVIKSASGKCFMGSLTEGADNVLTSKSHFDFRLRTPQEFFLVNTNDGSFQYEGVKRARGIDCDVWVGKKRSFWPGTNISGTLEWYFAKQSWKESTGQKPVFGMPLQVLINLPSKNKNVTYNLYSYEDIEPKLWVFDVTKCYPSTFKKYFKFKIPGSFSNLVLQNESKFRYSLLLAVSKIANVSTLRIGDLEIDYNSQDVFVKLSILGKSSFTGNVQHPVKQADLKTASAALQKALSSKDLMFSLGKGQTVTAMFLSAGENKKTYSGGAVAGLGVGMAVLFFAIGFLGFFLYYKKFVAPTVSQSGFEPKTFKNTKEDYD